MSEVTSNLKLFKYDVVKDAKQPFSIERALNDNWDILDDFCGSFNQTQIDWASNLQGKANIDGTNWNSSISKIDGQWVYKEVIINNNVNKAKGTYTYDMSSYLPNDGYNYEVIVHGVFVDTGSAECTCKLTSDIFGGTTASSATSHSQLVVAGYSNYCSADFIIPIGTGRKLYYILGVNAGDKLWLILQGYRRIGTNR